MCLFCNLVRVCFLQFANIWLFPSRINWRIILTSLNVHLIAARGGEWTRETRAAWGAPSVTEGPIQGDHTDLYNNYKPVFLKFYLATLVLLKIFHVVIASLSSSEIIVLLKEKINHAKCHRSIWIKIVISLLHVGLCFGQSQEAQSCGTTPAVISCNLQKTLKNIIKDEREIQSSAHSNYEFWKFPLFTYLIKNLSPYRHTNSRYKYI